MEIKDLKNHFLIAMPSIDDPIFKKSLVLICDDNQDGTMGLIINKPIDDILMQNMLLDSDFESDYIEKSKIHFGGPVNINTGFFLHESNYHTDNTINISKDLSLTVDHKVIKDLERNSGPSNFIFTLGYAGWNKNQLKDYLDLGLYIGITGWICDPRRNQDLLQSIKYIPMDRLLIETDAPYLMPKELEKELKTRRNEPKYIREIAEFISSHKGIKIESLASTTKINSENLFRQLLN